MIEDAADIHLVIRPGPDPLIRNHGINRTPEYRLKLLLKRLLRQFGFRCVSVGPQTPPPPQPPDV